MKEKAKNKYKNLSEEEKEAKKEYSKNRSKEMKKMQVYFYCIKMSEQTLKFGDIAVNKKEFHASKQAIALNLVNTNKIVISDKFKHSNDGSKFFIIYLHDDDILRTLCIILPQMSGYIKYFYNGGKNII